MGRTRLRRSDLRGPGIRRVRRGRGFSYATSHGVATLLRSHAAVRGDECRFCYVAKGGLDREVVIRDEALASVVKSLLRSRPGSDRLLVHREGRTWHEVHAADLNERFKQLAGDDCTAKDLRTWNATVLAAAAFAAADPPSSETARKRAEAGVMEEVSRALGNTPAVCRSSYVDPRLVEAYRGEHTIAAAVKRAGRVDGDDARAVLEKACARLLSRA